MPPKEGKKKKPTTFALSEFLSEGKSGSWADDGDVDFMLEEPLPGASLAADWRAQKGSGDDGGKFGRMDRRNEAPKPLPTSPPWSLHVGNLSYDSTSEDLTEFFETNKAKVKEVRLIMDRDTNRPKGFGYVEFHTLEDLQRALALNNQTVGGRRIRLDVTTDKGRGGDRSSGFGGGGGFVEFGGRDEMGSSQQPSMGGGGMGGMDRGGSRGPGVAWGRDDMGSAQQQDMQQRRPAGFGRDDMGTNVVQPPPPRGGFDRGSMGVQQQPTRERTVFSRDDLGSATQQASQPQQPPPQRKTVGAPAPWDRDALGSAAQPEFEAETSAPPERKFDRSGFGSSTDAWRASGDKDRRAPPSRGAAGGGGGGGGGGNWRNDDEAKQNGEARRPEGGFDRAGFGSSAQEAWRGGSSDNGPKRGGGGAGAGGGTGGAAGGGASGAGAGSNGGSSWRGENDTDAKKPTGDNKGKASSGGADSHGFTEVKKEEKEEKKEKKKQPKPKEDKKKDSPVAVNQWEVLTKKKKKK